MTATTDTVLEGDKLEVDLSPVVQAISELVASETAHTAEIVAAIRTLGTSDLKRLADSIKDSTSKLTATVRPDDKPEKTARPNEGGGLLGGFAKFKTGMAEGMKVFGGLVKVVTATLAALFVMNKMVEALSPSTAFMFSDALRNLTAVISQAFLPTIQVATNFFNDLSRITDHLAGSYGKLLGTLAASITDLLVPVLELMAGLLDVLITPFQFLADVVRDLTVGLNVMFTATNALIDGIRDILPTFGIFDVLNNTIKMVIESFVIMAAHLARLFVGPEGIQAWANKLKQQRDHEKVQKAAPQNIQIQGIEQIANQLAMNAAQGYGGTGKTQDEFLAEIVKDLEEIAHGKSFEDMIVQALNKWWNEIKDTVTPSVSGVTNRAGRLIDNIKNNTWLGRRLDRNT